LRFLTSTRIGCSVSCRTARAAPAVPGTDMGRAGAWLGRWLSNDIGHRRRHGRLERPPALRLLGSLQPAARASVRTTDLDEWRLREAAIPLVRAARLELAAGRHPERVGHHALDGRQFFATLLLARDRVEQALRVRVLGRE